MFVPLFLAGEVVRQLLDLFIVIALGDLVHDRRDLHKKIRMPVLALWGKRGVIHKLFNCLDDWREVAENVSGRAIDCGHFIPEEAPAKTLSEIRRFLRNHPM